jgi:hypothetical protein
MNMALVSFSSCDHQVESQKVDLLDRKGCTCCTPKKQSQLMRDAQMTTEGQDEERQEIPKLDEKEWFLTPVGILKSKVGM